MKEKNAGIMIKNNRIKIRTIKSMKNYRMVMNMSRLTEKNNIILTDKKK